MTQIFWTRRQILDGQIDRADRALAVAKDEALWNAPAIAAWIAAPAEWQGRADAATVLKSVLALEAARVMNATALKALRLTPSTVKRWRDAVAGARRRDKALNEACEEVIEDIRAEMHAQAMAEEAEAKARRLAAQGKGRTP